MNEKIQKVAGLVATGKFWKEAITVVIFFSYSYSYSYETQVSQVKNN